MTIASMTGFSRVAGNAGPYAWTWELKSVNAKGLDVRLRVPQGFDALEPDVRARILGKLTRGTIYASLAVKREAATPDLKINEDLLSRLVAAAASVRLGENLAPARLDGLLAVRGVIEVIEAAEDDAIAAQARRAALEGLDTALAALAEMRRTEGAALAPALRQRLEKIAALTRKAEVLPSRQPAAIATRLKDALTLLAANAHFDQNRLHQEALLMAAKADVREELDRLKAHEAAASALFAAGGAVGRRLDFLAQELSREANTLCAKSNDAALTELGLELRVEIEQFREQIQNIE